MEKEILEKTYDIYFPNINEKRKALFKDFYKIKFQNKLLINSR